MINGRTKGHSLERKAAKRLRDEKIFPKAQRRLEYQEGFGIDLQNTGNLSIQCKCTKKYVPLNEFLNIPVEGDRIRVLWAKADRLPELVVLSADDFIKIIQDIGVVYE